MAFSHVSARLDQLTSWNADWSGLRVAVLGLGATGFSVADTLAELGCDVLILAEDTAADYERLVPVIGARLRVGSLQEVPSELVDFGAELVVASPGFSPQHPIIRAVQESETALWGDIELAWRLRDKVCREDGSPADWLLVAGGDSVPETVQLAAAMMSAGRVRVAPCGNNGVPILDAIRDPAGFDVVLVELSISQLWFLAHGPHQVTPYASLCIGPDVHEGQGFVDAHRSTLAEVYENTRVACIYDKSDAATTHMVENADVVEGARAVGFDLGVPGPSDIGIVDGILVDRAFHDERRTSALELTTMQRLAVHGRDTPHAVAHILAASALARSVGVAPEVIAGTLDAGPRD